MNFEDGTCIEETFKVKEITRDAMFTKVYRVKAEDDRNHSTILEVDVNFDVNCTHFRALYLK
jgi:hypothetical protein